MLCCDGKRDIIKPLYEGFYDSVLFSYFEGVFGSGFCNDIASPKAAVICAGDFYFAAGSAFYAQDMLNFFKDNRFAVIVPSAEELASALINADGRLEKVKRFHTIPGDGAACKDALRAKAEQIKAFPNYRLEAIGRESFEKAMSESWSRAFVENFGSWDNYSQHGFGYIITDGEKILSGTSTYSFYSGGVEIEVSTREGYRLKGLAQITSAAFLLECTRRGLVPHWDARNVTSLAIAQKFGFKLRDEYTALEFTQDKF